MAGQPAGASSRLPPAGWVTWGAGQIRASALCSSDLRDGWLQALTQEDGSIYQLYRQADGANFRWMRANCLRLDDTAPCDVDRDHARSLKVSQVTANADWEGGPTLSSPFVSGIRGTDLGVTVEHHQRRFLLCGDTFWDRPGLETSDSIGEIHADGEGGLR